MWVENYGTLYNLTNVKTISIMGQGSVKILFRYSADPKEDFELKFSSQEECKEMFLMLKNILDFYE